MIYLNGVDNYLFRSLMREAGVKKACFSFIYSMRTPNVDWTKQLSFLDWLLVDPGLSHELHDYDTLIDFAEKYLSFINRHEDIITAAFDIPQLGVYIRDNTSVNIIPFFDREQMATLMDEPVVAVTTKDINTPFFGNYYRRLRESVQLHGYSLTSNTIEYNFNTLNTASWILGKYGYTFYFDGKTLQKYYRKKTSYRSFVARKLLQQGFDIDYNAILQDETEEVHLMNLIAWRQYNDFLERECKR